MAISANHSEPELEVVNIVDGSLKIDSSYQRKLSQRLVERIASNWDPFTADPLTISRRKNGKLFIVNGQHEAAAARLKGETEMLAFIWDGLSVAEEADLRLKKNNGKADTALEVFHAECAKKDPAALAIVAMLAKYGTRINESNNKHTGINCVGTIKALYAEDEVLLDRTLNVLTEAYGEVKGEAAQVAVLRATFWFFKVHRGVYTWSRVVQKFYEEGTEGLMRRAKSHQSVNRGAVWINYYRAIVETYNARLSEPRRLEVKTTYSASIEASPEDRWGGRESRRLRKVKVS